MAIDRSKPRWSLKEYKKERAAYEASKKKFKAPPLPEHVDIYRKKANAKKKELIAAGFSGSSNNIKKGIGSVEGIGEPPKGFVMNSAGTTTVKLETPEDRKQRKAGPAKTREGRLAGKEPSKQFSKALLELNLREGGIWQEGKDKYGHAYNEEGFRNSLKADRKRYEAMVKKANKKLGKKTASWGHALPVKKGGTDALSQGSLELLRRNESHAFENQKLAEYNRKQIDAGDTDINALRAYLQDGDTRGYVGEVDKIRILAEGEDANKVLSQREDRTIREETGLIRDRNVSQDEFESGRPLAFQTADGQTIPATRALDTAGDVRNLQRIGMGMGRHKAGLLSSYFTMQNAHRALQEARAPGANWQDKVQAALYGVEAALDVSAVGAAATTPATTLGGAGTALLLEGGSIAAGLTGDLSEAVQYFTSKEGRGALDSIWEPIWKRAQRIWNK